jgi:hypothetical protein
MTTSFGNAYTTAQSRKDSQTELEPAAASRAGQSTVAGVFRWLGLGMIAGTAVTGGVGVLVNDVDSSTVNDGTSRAMAVRAVTAESHKLILREKPEQRAVRSPRPAGSAFGPRSSSSALPLEGRGPSW